MAKSLQQQPSQQIKQLGLYATTNAEAELFVKRVTDFNKKHLTASVTLDIVPKEKGDEFVSEPHFKLELLFPSREIQEKFWTT